MHYVISDLHGCYSTYKKLLKKIRFSDKDTLYVLGDIFDRGMNPMSILLDMMKRKNVIPLLGNHEHMGLPILQFAHKCLLNKTSAESNRNYVDRQLYRNAEDLYNCWCHNGGGITLYDFVAREPEERQKILNYVSTFKPYYEVRVNGRDFVLVHAGIPHNEFMESKPLREYSVEALVWERIEITDEYYKKKILIVGHTPTHFIHEANPGKIFTVGNNIDIDCGCYYGYNLGAYCMETGEEFYVRASEEDI